MLLKDFLFMDTKECDSTFKVVFIVRVGGGKEGGKKELAKIRV
jgi:hypothetical protein